MKADGGYASICPDEELTWAYSWISDWAANDPKQTFRPCHFAEPGMVVPQRGPGKLTMTFWWVNQKQTCRQEFDGGCSNAINA